LSTRGAADELLEADVARLAVEDVLAAVCAPEASSGAGVAAALALALAAACARKAIGVTLKRHAPGAADAASLDALEQQLLVQQHRAVAHARRDALLFKAWLDTKEPRQAQHLVDSARHFQALVNDMGDAVGQLRERVAGVVAGDVEAAAALHGAVARISADLLHEARGERNRA